MTRYWRIDPETKELLGSVDSDLEFPDDHLSLTKVKPPSAEAGKVRIFNRVTQTWLQVEDHRGTKCYRTEDGRETPINRLGPLPATVTIMPRPSEVHRWDGRAWVEDAGLIADQQRKQRQLEALARIASLPEGELTVVELAIALGLRQ